jgi:hypothetical protein
MVTAKFVLAMMLLAEPHSPFVSTFEKTAEAIADAANASPVFDGEDGTDRTAALLVSVAWYESRFQVDAAGDCAKKTAVGTCAGGKPRSFGLFQIHESNHAWLGVTREQITADPEVAAAAALKMIHASFVICRARPLEGRLGWYARGGSGCPEESRESKHRVLKARWLFAHAVRTVAP